VTILSIVACYLVMDQVSEIVFFWGYYNTHISTKVGKIAVLQILFGPNCCTIVLCFEKSSNLPKKNGKNFQKNSRF